jgi:hypothetical protein
MPAPPCWVLVRCGCRVCRVVWLAASQRFMQSDGASVSWWKVYYCPIVFVFAAELLPIHSTDTLTHTCTVYHLSITTPCVYCEAVTMLIHHWPLCLHQSKSFTLHTPICSIPQPTRSTGNCMHVTMQIWMNSRVVVRGSLGVRLVNRIFPKPHRHGAVTFPVKE